MPSIAFAVRDIVEQIDDARQRAEDAKAATAASTAGRVEQSLAEQQTGEDEEVLGPLGRTQRDEQVKDERRARMPRRARHREPPLGMKCCAPFSARDGLDLGRCRKTPDGFVFRIEGLEHSQQLRDGQEVGDAFGQVEQLQAAALPAHGVYSPYDFAEPRANMEGGLATLPR